MGAITFFAARLSPVNFSFSPKNIRASQQQKPHVLSSSSSPPNLLSRTTPSRLCPFPSIEGSDPSRWSRKVGVSVACLPSTQPSPPSSSGGASRDRTRLYISGLSFRTSEESLRNAFENFGQLVEVNLVMDRIANRPKGYAFLRYSTEDEATKAIGGMHGKFLHGRVIFVEVAKPRTEARSSAKKSQMRF